MECKTILTTCLLILTFNIQAQSNYYGRNQLRPLTSTCESGRTLHILLPGNVLFRDSVNGTKTYSIPDHEGSTRSSINNDNNILLCGDYDPYGNLNGSIQEKQKEQYHYAGNYNWTNETRMYSTATRKFEPKSFRFISQDVSLTGFTPYNFTGNNPINFTDLDGMAPTDVKDYDNPDFAGLFKHPVFPEQPHLDEDSYNTLKLMEPENALAGIMNIKTGDIYLIPLTPIDWLPNWKGRDFKHTARMNGDVVTSLLHTKRNTSHGQLIRMVIHKNKEMGYRDFVGFHIRYSPTETYLHLGPRSLTAQEGKFPQWIGASKHGYESFTQHRTLVASTLYKDMYSELLTKYQNSPGYTLQSAAKRAIHELNTQYKATEEDYHDLAEEEYWQGMYMFGSWRETILKPVSTAPNYDDVIKPIKDSQMPLPFANKIVDFFKTLPGLPAPMKLIMQDQSSPF